MSWQLDEGHTHVGFTIRHMMVSTVRGEFEKVRGTVEFDEHDLIPVRCLWYNVKNKERSHSEAEGLWSGSHEQPRTCQLKKSSSV